MVRRVAAGLAVLVIVPLLLARAEGPGRDAPAPPAFSKEEAALKQEMLARAFREFEQTLLRMAQRLEKSSKPEDQDKAAVLRKALKYSAMESVDRRFDALVGILKKSDIGLGELQEAMVHNQMVLGNIRAILALLLDEGRDAKLRAEIAWLADIVKELDKAIRAEKLIRAHIEAGRMGKGDLADEQGKVTRSTEDIQAAIQKKVPAPEGDRDPGKHVQSAIGNQKNAQGKIDGGDVPGASPDVDGAITDLTRARDLFEKILRQRREEELRRRLASLLSRCELMLAMQVPVREETVRLHEVAGERPDPVAGRAAAQKALQLADREGDILKIANEAAKLVEEEGSAVAFAEVFTQLRDDMRAVQRRLGRADVGVVTQSVEQDIIDTLKEMIEALKKAVQPAPPSDHPPDPSQRPPRDPQLIDRLAELKMVRSMQVRVNARTTTYGRQYPGEQADDPAIRQELKDLADRQQKISQVTQEIGKPKN